MKRFLLLVLVLCSLCATALAEEGYPKANYEQYYKGNGHYPIAFVQWGEGYVLDGYTAMQLGSEVNTLVVDVHPVNMLTGKFSPQTQHVIVQYKPHRSFTAWLQKERGLGAKPKDAPTFTTQNMGGPTAKTGMLFPAGRMLWELVKHEAFFKGEKILKPIGEAGCPLYIEVEDDVRYARMEHNRASILHQGFYYTILFTPTYFILEGYMAPDAGVRDDLEALMGKMQPYESNKVVALVRRYMGVPEP